MRTCSFRCQTRRLQERRDGSVELRVSIQDHITIGASFRKRFTQLLDDPVRNGVPRHVEVQDLPTAVFDYEEAIEQLKRQRRYGEEVESDDYFTMVLEKCLPPFPGIATPPHSPQIASDRPFRDLEAERQWFGMDLGRSPIGRRARTSRAVSLRLRKKSWSAEKSARIVSTTNSPF